MPVTNMFIIMAWGVRLISLLFSFFVAAVGVWWVQDCDRFR